MTKIVILYCDKWLVTFMLMKSGNKPKVKMRFTYSQYMIQTHPCIICKLRQPPLSSPWRCLKQSVIFYCMILLIEADRFPQHRNLNIKIIDHAAAFTPMILLVILEILVLIKIFSIFFPFLKLIKTIKMHQSVLM